MRMAALRSCLDIPTGWSAPQVHNQWYLPRSIVNLYPSLFSTRAAPGQGLEWGGKAQAHQCSRCRRVARTRSGACVLRFRQPVSALVFQPRERYEALRRADAAIGALCRRPVIGVGTHCPDTMCKAACEPIRPPLLLRVPPTQTACTCN